MKDASIPTALIMRVSLVKLSKLWEFVEIDVDDLFGRWWYTGFSHDDKLVWGELHDGCDLPVATFIRQNSLSRKAWQFNLP
jgi:hypothetical protein|eukprot:1945514-Prymnesium_polylepis.1